MKSFDSLFKIILPIFILVSISSCLTNTKDVEKTPEPMRAEKSTSTLLATPMEKNIKADVISVDARGEPGAYTFSVGIQSPDLGCSQYADWWEVIDEQGNLLYRRILAHSHVNEQPFKRSGGPVTINADTTVWVRAHMHPHGYGGEVLKGSFNSGFQPAELPQGFAVGLDEIPPLPENCAF